MGWLTNITFYPNVCNVRVFLLVLIVLVYGSKTFEKSICEDEGAHVLRGAAFHGGNDGNGHGECGGYWRSFVGGRTSKDADN